MQKQNLMHIMAVPSGTCGVCVCVCVGGGGGGGCFLVCLAFTRLGGGSRGGGGGGLDCHTL